MTVSKTTIHQQLRAILALTTTEIQIAETRQGQARTDSVRRELAGNARKARQRAADLEQAIGDRDGHIDVIRPVIGRIVATFKTVVEQAQPFDEALLDDLALEQRLLARATYLKALAVGADDTGLVALAERLVAAHTETIDWLTKVLAEEALGGPAALHRSPTQWVSGLLTRAVTLPAVAVGRGIDRTAGALRRIPQDAATVRRDVDDAVEQAADAAERIGQAVAAVGEATVNSAASGRDAVLATLESDARSRGADTVADGVHSAREAVGSVAAEDLPIDDYAALNVGQASAGVRKLTDPADIRLVLRYEEAHKNRQGVISAAEDRIADLASAVVNS